MSAKVKVLPGGTHEKRHVARRQVRRGLWRWVREDEVAEVLAIRETPAAELLDGDAPTVFPTFVPVYMPPAEVPNVKFIAPPVKDAGDQGAYFGV